MKASDPASHPHIHTGENGFGFLPHSAPGCFFPDRFPQLFGLGSQCGAHLRKVQESVPQELKGGVFDRYVDGKHRGQAERRPKLATTF